MLLHHEVMWASSRTIVDEDGCWVFTGSTNGSEGAKTGGYGLLWDRRRKKIADRARRSPLKVVT